VKANRLPCGGAFEAAIVNQTLLPLNGRLLFTESANIFAISSAHNVSDFLFA